MKEYKGIIKNIIVADDSIDTKITFIVRVGFKELTITENHSVEFINLHINDEVIVREDMVLNKKTYSILLEGEDYDD